MTKLGETVSFSEAASQLPATFGAVFTAEGRNSCRHEQASAGSDHHLRFSLSDTFDTMAPSSAPAAAASSPRRMRTTWPNPRLLKMDKALFADAIATSIGSVVGTSNTTTYVESAAGIGVGGRTGLTSVVVAALFAASAFLSSLVSAIPSAATAPALVMVGIMMLASFREINWTELEDAVPAFFSGVFMALCYSISYGIAFGFISYCLVKTVRGKAKEVHPILWVSTLLFILNFVLLALL